MSHNERRSPIRVGRPCTNLKCAVCRPVAGETPRVRLLDTSGAAVKIVTDVSTDRVERAVAWPPLLLLPSRAKGSLTANDREALRATALSLRSSAELIDEALGAGDGKGRVDLALGALGFVGRVAATAAGIAGLIGKDRA